jgi:predicted transcriptional regulator
MKQKLSSDLDKVLKERNITRSQIILDVPGIDYAFLYKLERGKEFRLNTGKLLQVADYLGVPVQRLFYSEVSK